MIGWIAYFGGAGGALAYKLARYLVHAKQYGETPLQALKNWFFEGSAENGVSWLTTVGCVWALGAWINGGFYFGDEPQQVIPTHPSLLFTVGTLAEMIAPTLAKKLVARIAGYFGG